MAKFMTRLVVNVVEDGKFELVQDLVYWSDLLPKILIVPAGFVTDFASVPRLPFSYLLAGGVANKAAVVHDYLYEKAIGTKGEADRVFLEAMLATGVSRWRAQLMYWAVCLGGKGNFDEVLV